MSQTQTQSRVLAMLRQARAKPKNASILNTCGKPAAVSGAAALPMLYELEHGPAAAPAAATATLPVRTTATKTTTTAAKTSGTATKASGTATKTTTTAAKTTSTTAAKTSGTATKTTSGATKTNGTRGTTTAAKK